jgi:uncharacterized membrane protein YhaH (DUF805 family)
MSDALQDYLRRPKRYDNIDGTGEIYMGLMILGFALLGYLQTVLPKDSMWSTNGFAGLLFMYLVLVPVLALGYWGVRAIKKHLTWPRTGYVAYGVGGLPGKAKRAYWAVRVSVAVLSIVIAAGLGGLVAFERKHQGAMGPAGVGYVLYLAFWVPLYAFWIRRMGKQHPWKWLMLLLMALGLLVIGLLGPGDVTQVARPVMSFVGLVWFISGAATLGSYLRRTQAPAAGAE